MKNIIILSSLLIACSSIKAQTTIYAQDFGGGVPAGWVITDSTGAGKVWTYDTNGPSGGAGNPADTLKSTTYSNGIMIMDDDWYGQAPGFDATALISSAINCSAYNKVKIKFQDFYRHFVPAASQGVLYVSVDSVTWSDVYHVEAGLGNNQTTPNPHLPDIDITAIAANQPALYLKFVYRGDWGFYWELDDIEVYEPAPSAVDEKGPLATVKFFPNPSAGWVNVTGLNETATVTISNEQGQIVLVKNLHSLRTHVLDLNNQPAGVYHFRLQSKNAVVNQSINLIK